MNRELGPRLTAALVARGVADPTAHLAGERGAIAFKRGYAGWSGSDTDGDLAPYAVAALEDLRAASASLG